MTTRTALSARARTSFENGRVDASSARIALRMSKGRHTLPGIAREILAMYQSLAGDRALVDAQKAQNLLGKRISFLQAAVAGAIQLDELTQDQGVTLQETLLDAIALQTAGGGRTGVYAPYDLKIPTLLGRARIRRARLRESEQSQLDWHFQTMVQAWAATNSQRPIKDLQTEARFQSRRSCDFAIVRPSSRTELLECKRLHIHPENNRPHKRLEEVTSKITQLLPEAHDQLKSTADIIGPKDCDLHLLIDITAYADSHHVIQKPANQVKLRGFHDNDLELIAFEITPMCNEFTQVTLCWHSLVWIDGLYRAIVQKSMVLLNPSASPELLN